MYEPLDNDSPELLAFLSTQEDLLQLAAGMLAKGELDTAACLVNGAIHLTQTHLHGVSEDPRVDQIVAGIATAAFGKRRVRIPVPGERLRVGFVIRHLLDTRGGGKSHFFIVDRLREHGFETAFYVPEVGTSQLRARVDKAGIPVRRIDTDRRPLALARELRRMLEADEIDIVFSYDMGDWLGGTLACLGGDTPVTLFDHNTDHLFAACIHAYECHVALRRLTLNTCRRYRETARCKYLPLPGSLGANAEPDSKLTRSEIGVAEDAVVTMTVTSFSKLVGGSVYFEALDEVLQRHPSAMHVLIGSGDARQTRFVDENVRRMEAGGRVVLLGRRTDVAGLLRLADVFVDSHPIGGMTACMEAMQAGLPALALSEGRDPLFSGEEALELPECIAPTRDEFTRRLNHLVGDREAREDLGSRLKTIYARTFDPGVVVSQYAEFLRSLPGVLKNSPVCRRDSTEPRLLHPVRLGNFGEREPIDYVKDAYELACIDRSVSLRLCLARQVIAVFPGLLTRRGFWSVLCRGAK